MTMLEYLEHDKERLLAELQETGHPDQAGMILAEEADRLLLVYNEHCEDESKREAAACMMQTARMSAALLDTVGETRIWEELPGDKVGKGRKVLILADKLGIAVVLAAAIGAFVTALLADPSALRASDVLLALLLTAAAPGVAFLVGKAIGRRNPLLEKGSSSYRSEHFVDAQRVYLGLRNMIVAVDQNLERLPVLTEASGEVSKYEDRGEMPLDKASVEIFADLLEASLSEDGEYALEKLADIRFYLHRKQVETVLYDGSNRELFDFMPAAKPRTFRPALVKDGIVLKKGLASEGRA